MRDGDIYYLENYQEFLFETIVVGQQDSRQTGINLAAVFRSPNLSNWQPKKSDQRRRQHGSLYNLLLFYFSRKSQNIKIARIKEIKT